MKIILKNKKSQVLFDLKKILKDDYKNKSHVISFRITTSEDCAWLHEFKIISDEIKEII